MWRRVATRALRLSALPAAFAAHHACCDSAPPSDRVRKVAASIDHTLLKPDAMPRDVQRLCEEAALHRFASVCVNPVYVGLARAVLNELGCPEIPVCAVVGFPLGASTSAVKAFEAEAAIAEGADEIDMVLPIGVLKAAARHDDDGEALSYVLRDIAAVVSACRRHEGVVCKVILETCLLTPAERDLGVLLCSMAGANFVKTSTGFSTGGATVSDVAAMALASRQSAEGGGVHCQVKASGGIRNAADAEAMLAAGATRLGCSAGVKIVSELVARDAGTAAAPAQTGPDSGAY